MPRAFYLPLDFETANHKPESACAIGWCASKTIQVVAAEEPLDSAAFRWFAFTDIHSITWGHGKDRPRFAAVWHELLPPFDDAVFIAAHKTQASIAACCACLAEAGLPPPNCRLLHHAHGAARAQHLSHRACGGGRATVKFP